MSSSFCRAHGKPICNYGVGCYRKNADHWASFDHPELHFAFDKHFMNQDGQCARFMEVPAPRPPSCKAVRDLTWEFSRVNVRGGEVWGEQEPSYPRGTWEHAMLARWPEVARALWRK